MQILTILIFLINVLNLSIRNGSNSVPINKSNVLSKVIEDSTLVFVKGGTFKMGSKLGEKDELPVHKVKISDFYIGKHEVTNSEFVEFLNEKGNIYEHNSYWINVKGHWRDLKCNIYQKNNYFFVEQGYENYPVNYVNWYGANAYCKWKGGRLPTEAEWEYASTNYKNNANNRNIDEIAWYSVNSDNKIQQVGAKKPNAFGIYDMQGNLWEWCSDWYNAEYYAKSKRKNPQNLVKADYKVMRGGSWANDKTMLRISNRNAVKPNTNKINLGFRIVYEK